MYRASRLSGICLLSGGPAVNKTAAGGNKAAYWQPEDRTAKTADDNHQHGRRPSPAAEAAAAGKAECQHPSVRPCPPLAVWVCAAVMEGDPRAGQPRQAAAAAERWTRSAVWEDPDPAVRPQQGGLPLQAQAGGHPATKAGDQEAAPQQRHPGQDFTQHRGAEVKRNPKSLAKSG